MTATCSACGRPRFPLASSSVTHAGQPSKVGGTVARVFGWLVLGGGLVLAALVAFLAFLVAPGSMAPWLLSIPIAAVSMLVGWLLLRSGRELHSSGSRTEHQARRRAVIALAATRGNVVTATDVARTLDIGLDDADALLTRLAKEEMELVSVDVDEHGTVLYRFGGVRWPSDGGGFRVATQAPVAASRVEAVDLAERGEEQRPDHDHQARAHAAKDHR